MTQATSTRRLPSWRLWLPLVLQSLLILAIPAQSAYIYVTGRSVILQTAPIDPYDLMRGYSQTLGYEISRRDVLTKLPGGTMLNNNFTGDFYVTLEAPTNQTKRPPQAWKPVQVSRDRPTNLPPNQIALKGNLTGWLATYNLETYYMPDDQREQINADISKIQQQNQRSFVVEIRVDQNGNAVPVSLWVRDRNYQF